MKLKHVRVFSNLTDREVEDAINAAIENASEDETIEYEMVMESTVQIGDERMNTYTLVIEIYDGLDAE